MAAHARYVTHASCNIKKTDNNLSNRQTQFMKWTEKNVSNTQRTIFRLIKCGAIFELSKFIEAKN